MLSLVGREGRRRGRLRRLRWRRLILTSFLISLVRIPLSLSLGLNCIDGVGGVGRNTIKKDHHLRDLVLNPDVQQVEILPFDEETLREAFTLKVGVIPGFDSLIWETELEMGGRKKVRLFLLVGCRGY